MTSMVERVARALSEQLACVDLPDYGENDDVATAWKKVARAAILAMRYMPDEVRLAAVGLKYRTADDPPFYEMLWTLMIDAALEEK